MQILLANPRGFCAGVKRAIDIVEYGLRIYGAPIYVYHEIVHNHCVVEGFRKRGVIFIEQINEVPSGAVLIFSAHGVSQAVREEAKSRNFTIFDATCPLVTKIHMEVSRASHRCEELILIGHGDHPEVKGTLGQYNNSKGRIYLVESQKDAWTLKVKDENHLSFVTQTTLSIKETKNIIDILRRRFPKIIGSYRGSICYATINRQKATYELAKQADIVLVVGSKNSSNSNRLVEIVRHVGKEAFLIEDTSCIKEKWIGITKCIGITAGASTPDILVQKVLEYLKILGATEIRSLNGRKEKVFFRTPMEFRVNINR